MLWLKNGYDKVTLARQVLDADQSKTEQVCPGYERTAFAIGSTVCMLHHYTERNVYDVVRAESITLSEALYLFDMQYIAQTGRGATARVRFDHNHAEITKSTEMHLMGQKMSPAVHKEIWDDIMSRMDVTLIERAEILGQSVTAAVVDDSLQLPHLAA